MTRTATAAYVSRIVCVRVCVAFSPPHRRVRARTTAYATCTIVFLRQLKHLFIQTARHRRRRHVCARVRAYRASASRWHRVRQSETGRTKRRCLRRAHWLCAPNKDNPLGAACSMLSQSDARCASAQRVVRFANPRNDAVQCATYSNALRTRVRAREPRSFVSYNNNVVRIICCTIVYEYVLLGMLHVVYRKYSSTTSQSLQQQCRKEDNTMVVL